MPRQGILSVALAGLVLLASANACGERREPTAATVSLYPVALTSADRETVVDSEPRRILPLTRTAERVLRALGVGDRIVGGRALLRREAGGPGALPPVRELRRIRPDLIVASPLASVAELERGAAAAGDAAVYLAADGSYEDVVRSISQLAVLVGRPLEARRTVASLQSRRRAVADRVRGRPPVSVFVDQGFFFTVSSRTLIGDLIRIAGGDNVAGATPEPGPFDLRQLARADPDVYLATSESETTLADLRRSRETRHLTAVRRGRFGIVPRDLLQPGPRLAEGLETVARLLHPDAFR